MTDRDYSLGNILIDTDIPDQLKCGICMDVFRDPIYCRGGHTWCQSCILLSNDEGCPICDYTVLPHTYNVALRNLIGTFFCKCPYSKSSLPSDSGNTSEKLPALTDWPFTTPGQTSCGHSMDSGKECYWTGPYGRLQHHLESECPAEPRTLCLYAQNLSCLGCTLNGTKAQLAKHYFAVRVPYQYRFSIDLSDVPTTMFTLYRAPPCLLVLSTGRKCYIHFIAIFGHKKQNDCYLRLDFSETTSEDDTRIPCDISGSTISIRHSDDPKKDLELSFLTSRLVEFNDGKLRRLNKVYTEKSAFLSLRLTEDVTSEDFSCYFVNDTLYLSAEMKADEQTTDAD